MQRSDLSMFSNIVAILRAVDLPYGLFVCNLLSMIRLVSKWLISVLYY